MKITSIMSLISKQDFCSTMSNDYLQQHGHIFALYIVENDIYFQGLSAAPVIA